MANNIDCLLGSELSCRCSVLSFEGKGIGGREIRMSSGDALIDFDEDNQSPERRGQLQVD